ncbi:MAG: hypothetical protein ACE5J3_09040 [Methanosarcinales archaeon]
MQVHSLPRAHQRLVLAQQWYRGKGLASGTSLTVVLGPPAADAVVDKNY